MTNTDKGKPRRPIALTGKLVAFARAVGLIKRPVYLASSGKPIADTRLLASGYIQ